MSNEQLSIMIFTWNADGLRLCETNNQDVADANRKGFKAFITAKKPRSALINVQKLGIKKSRRFPDS